MSSRGQILEAKNMVCEGTWTAVTLGTHSRAMHDSEPYLFKTHTVLWEFLPRKMHLNSKYCIYFRLHKTHPVNSKESKPPD